MTRARLDGLLLFVLGSVLFVCLGSAWERTSPVSMADFKGLYYGARCLLQHSDPYQESEVLRVYQAEGGNRPSDPDRSSPGRDALYQPADRVYFTVPFGMLPWGPAHVLWMILTAQVSS